MMDFQNIGAFYYLLAIPFLLVLYFLYNRWKYKSVHKIGESSLVNTLLTSTSSQMQNVKFGLRLASLLLLIIALANFRKGTESKKFEQTGRDIVIALDVSKSMLATDVKPSRLEKAKLFISKMLDSNSNNRIALVVFAGKAYTSVPLTTDIGALRLNLQAISTNSVPTQGTALASAIDLAHACFNTKQISTKIILLITDGEDHEEGVNSAVEACANDGIQINTIGIGSAEGGKIIDPETLQPKTDDDGKEVISKLNEEELKTIAQKGNGVYQNANNLQESINTITQSINSMEASSLGAGQFTSFVSYFQWFLAPALLLLLIEILIPNAKKMTL